MDNIAPEKFAQYCIVEIMGHIQLAGFVTEQTIAGKALLRVDVPEVPEKDGRWEKLPAIPGYSRFFGADAIFSLTPCTFEAAQAAANTFRNDPIRIYLPDPTPAMTTAPQRALPAWEDADHETIDTDLSEEKPTCACAYCPCAVEVEFEGETCSDCRMGEHQG